jgi:hypothetical protein
LKLDFEQVERVHAKHRGRSCSNTRKRVVLPMECELGNFLDVVGGCARVLVHVLGRNLDVRMDSESETVWTCDVMRLELDGDAGSPFFLFTAVSTTRWGVNNKRVRRLQMNETPLLGISDFAGRYGPICA